MRTHAKPVCVVMTPWVDGVHVNLRVLTCLFQARRGHRQQHSGSSFFDCQMRILPECEGGVGSTASSEIEKNA